MEDLSQTVEGEYISHDDLKSKVKYAVKNINRELGITKFMATFVNDNGLICDFKTVQDILIELKSEEMIEIVRYPAKTATGKDSSFWEEKDGKTVMIRRLKA